MVISRRAAAEITETLRYIARESPDNAVRVAAAITRKIAQVRHFPRSAPIDVHAPVPPGAAEPRIAQASGFLIRYVFPFRKDAHEVVFVVSITRAAQTPPDETEYLHRFLQEAAGAFATSPAGSAP